MYSKKILAICVYKAANCNKLCCDSCFQRAFTAWVCVLKEINYLGWLKGKRTLKITFGTEL